MSDDISTLETIRENAERAGDLEVLARSCETAEGPSADLDERIAVAIAIPHPKHGRPIGMIYSPKYTASLDAAASLIPDGYDWILERVNDGLTIGARVGHNNLDRTSWGETPALALCAAALRSRMPTR